MCSSCLVCIHIGTFLCSGCWSSLHLFCFVGSSLFYIPWRQQYLFQTIHLSAHGLCWKQLEKVSIHMTNGKRRKTMDNDPAYIAAHCNYDRLQQTNASGKNSVLPSCTFSAFIREWNPLKLIEHIWHLGCINWKAITASHALNDHIIWVCQHYVWHRTTFSHAWGVVRGLLAALEQG